MKKRLSLFLALAMLVPSFGTLSAFAADSETAQTDTGRAEIYDKDGNYDYASPTLDGAVSYAEQFGGTVKLLADRTENEPLKIHENGNVTIDLNGHKIKRSQDSNKSDKDGGVIRLEKGAKLTITDTSEAKNGTIEGGGAKWGGGIYAPDNNVVTMNAGTITNCTAYYGGGAYVDESSKFIMNGGKINKCYATYGGGVYVEDEATFETNGGEISDCVASEDGGGICIWSAYANLNRCYIANNHADDGGAIFSDYNSYITISGSTIVSNTADDCYGGIYHCDGRLTLQNGTTISDNKSNGKYGGGVFSDSSIELGGAVYIYGNRSGIDEPCDVSFGKDLNSAFKIINNLSDQSLIGVNINHNPKTWYNGDHVSYGSCREEDEKKANSLATALFSNFAYGSGFSYTFEEKSGDLYEHLHYVRVISDGSSDSSKINVTEVTYRNVQLPQSDYTAEYDYRTHTIVLNVPDYVKNQEYLNVYTDNYNINFFAGNKVATSGWSDNYKTRCGLIVKNDNESKTYTVSVEGGTVDGKNSAQKKYFDDLKIEPDVPEDKIFSHWEVEGDYTISSIIGFNQYTKIPPNVLMPNGNVKFKAVFKDKVTQVDVKLTLPKIGSPTAFYVKTATNPCLTATACYKNANGDVIEEAPIDVTWAMDENRDRTRPIAVHYFDYDVQYSANFQVEDTPNGKFGLADQDEISMSLYIDDNLVAEEKETYFTNYEYVYGDGYNWRWENDNNPIKQRILHATYYYRSEKAPVRKAVPSQISVPTGTMKDELIKLLPESVNVEIADINYTNGKEQSETTHSPVVWNKDNLPDTVTESFTIQGTLNTENEGFEVQNGDVIQAELIVDPITQGKSQMPQVTVDGTPVTVIDDTAKIALDKKIKLTTSMEGADIYYKLDGKEFVKYIPDSEIEIDGTKNAVTTYELEAYAEANGQKSETLKLTIEVDNKTTYTVNILDTDGSEYKYATGGGEYKLGDTVSVDLTQKYMHPDWEPGFEEKWVSDPHKTALSWSANGILLNDEQMANPVFNFEMPNSNVIVKIESFKYKNQVHIVTIVDKDGKTYEYALGSGDYKEGDTVTIDSTQFMLKSVDADGKVTSEKTNVPEKVVSQWSAEGITLTEEQMKADKFEFTMPYNDVTIKAENFRYLVKKLYLSSLTPIAGQALPDKLEIISARDINGNLIDKDDILLKTELYADSGGTWTTDEGMVPPETKAEIGKTYITIFSVQPVSSEMAALDDYEIYMDDKKIDSAWGAYLIPVEVKAVKDELLSVDLSDSITVYKASDAVLPGKVNVRTKYGTETEADVTWDKKVPEYLTHTAYEVTATIHLPDYIDVKDELKTKTVTVIIFEPISGVIMNTKSGNIPAKPGEKLPGKDNISTKDSDETYNPKLNSFKILSEDGTDVTGMTAEDGKKYTVKATIASKSDYTVLTPNTLFTINGKTMDIVGSSADPDSKKGNIYEVEYTFTASSPKTYDVFVNGTSIGKKQNGDTVNISANAVGFSNWTAEVVYTTEETFTVEPPKYDKDGNLVTEGKTETKTVEHRSPINLFKDGAEYTAETSFVMPLLVDDNAKLEITANYAYGITAYDRETKEATVISDKDYSNAAVIFATYGADGTLLSAKLVNTNLSKGQNTVTAPDDFTVNDGEKLKVMVWNNMENMTPLFAAFEQTYEKTSEETGSTGDTGDAEITEGTENEN